MLLGSCGRYGAEPLLDGAQFGSAKGRIAEEEQVSEEAQWVMFVWVKLIALTEMDGRRQKQSQFGG